MVVNGSKGETEVRFLSSVVRAGQHASRQAFPARTATMLVESSEFVMPAMIDEILERCAIEQKLKSATKRAPLCSARHQLN